MQPVATRTEVPVWVHSDESTTQRPSGQRCDCSPRQPLMAYEVPPLVVTAGHISMLGVHMPLPHRNGAFSGQNLVE